MNSAQFRKNNDSKVFHIPSRGTIQTHAVASKRAFSTLPKRRIPPHGPLASKGRGGPSDIAGHSVGLRQLEPCGPSAQAEFSPQTLTEARLDSLMILPQVHLRKPCYDFYFL